jgi:hypothetical protein
LAGLQFAAPAKYVYGLYDVTVAAETAVTDRASSVVGAAKATAENANISHVLRAISSTENGNHVQDFSIPSS